MRTPTPKEVSLRPECSPGPAGEPRPTEHGLDTSGLSKRLQGQPGKFSRKTTFDNKQIEHKTYCSNQDTCERELEIGLGLVQVSRLDGHSGQSIRFCVQTLLRVNIIEFSKRNNLLKNKAAQGKDGFILKANCVVEEKTVFSPHSGYAPGLLGVLC